MFNNFRKKLNSVILDSRIGGHETSYGRQLSVPIFGTHTNGNSAAQHAEPMINVRAGCNVLEKQTDEWKEIHRLNEENAMQAAEIDATIENLKCNSTNTLASMTDLNSLLCSVPSICSTLAKCSELARDLKKSCCKIADELLELEDLIEMMEMQGQRLDHQYEMAMYKEKKLAELDQVRQEMVNNHSGRVREYESKLKQAQLERQAVFQEAFQNDIECYKTLGTIPKVDLPSNSTEVTLEEIVLDNRETEEFINFLNN